MIYIGIISFIIGCILILDRFILIDKLVLNKKIILRKRNVENFESIIILGVFSIVISIFSFLNLIIY